jgi:hypothetical protein
MPTLASKLAPFDLAHLARDITVALVAKLELDDKVALDNLGTLIGKMYANCLSEIAAADMPNTSGTSKP